MKHIYELKEFLNILYEQTNDSNFLELIDKVPSKFEIKTDSNTMQTFFYYYNGWIFFPDFEQALLKSLVEARRQILVFKVWEGFNKIIFY